MICLTGDTHENFSRILDFGQRMDTIKHLHMVKKIDKMRLIIEDYEMLE